MVPSAPAQPTAARATGAPAVDGNALAHHVGYLLRRAFVLSTDCARACITDDTPLREVALLALLAERAPLSQRELGDLLHVNRSVMVKLIDSMEERGLVARVRNPTDRRSYALRVTPEGERVRHELLGELGRGDEQLTARLTTEERTRLNEALVVLLDDPDLAPIASLAQHSGYLIAQSHRLLRTRALDRLRPLGLDPRDFGILSVLGSHQPCSQNQLAGQLGVSPPAAFAWLEDLAARGLVSRDRSGSDRRVHEVTLTAKGERCLRAARSAVTELDRELVAALGSRYEQLHRLLRKLID